jgi:hypothetical protein
MFYLEDLTLKDIKFLKQLLEDYRETHTAIEDGKFLPLPIIYHTFKEKLKRLVKYVSYNPNETETPKKPSKYSEAKKFNKRAYRIKKEIIKNG